MEEEKKNKRNKKKKNKQHSKVEEDTGAAGADDAVSASVELHRSLTNGKYHQSELVGAASANLDPSKHHTNGVEASSVAEEKHDLLHIQAALEENQETIKHLRNENALHEQKEAGLEIIIDQMQNEKESWAKKEVRLEKKIGIISNEKASLEVKQEILEGKIRQLEREYNFFVLKEQPSELDVLNTQLEEARALVERLVIENAELVEKVDELYVELGQYKARDWLSSSDSIIKIDETLPGNTEPPEVVQVQDMTSTGGDKEDAEASIAVSNSFKSDESGEIVQIPLNENDTVVQTEELQGRVEREKTADVPFMDAPLIGAPFRLISFVASYVSGADLVDKK